MIAGGKYLSSSAYVYLDIMPSQLEIHIHASVLSQLLLVCLHNPFCVEHITFMDILATRIEQGSSLLSRDSIIFNIMGDFVNNRL